jgi:hypothetical protein
MVESGPVSFRQHEALHDVSVVEASRLSHDSSKNNGLKASK